MNRKMSDVMKAFISGENPEGVFSYSDFDQQIREYEILEWKKVTKKLSLLQANILSALSKRH